MLTRKTLFEQVLEELVSRIKSGLYTPGELLPTEQELSQEFNVSRNCIRETIKCLNVGGLVYSRPGKGTYLTHDASKIVSDSTNPIIDFGTLNSLSELTELRLLIEPEAAAMAAQRASKNQCKELKNILDQLKKDVLTSGYKMSGLKFHNLVIKMTGNRYLQKVMNSIYKELYNSRNYFLDTNINKFFCDEHQKIYEAIFDQDAELARSLMQEHLENIRKILALKIV